MYKLFFSLALFVFLSPFTKVQSQILHESHEKQKADTTTVTIQLHHFAGKEILKLDDATYTNELGQSFTVSNFKYYMGKIRLIDEKDRVTTTKDYYLIKEEETETKTIELHNIPEGIYKSVSFIIGVDSIDNCSGAQSGALDPTKGMFWTWNTGYIFLKLEGNAKLSTSPGNIFEYHIGGFKQPNNCIRRVNITFAEPVLISNKQKNKIDLKADVLEILKTPSTLDFSKLSSITDHKNATLVADNYSDMFSVLKETK